MGNVAGTESRSRRWRVCAVDSLFPVGAIAALGSFPLCCHLVVGRGWAVAPEGPFCDPRLAFTPAAAQASPRRLLPLDHDFEIFSRHRLDHIGVAPWQVGCGEVFFLAACNRTSAPTEGEPMSFIIEKPNWIFWAAAILAWFAGRMTQQTVTVSQSLYLIFPDVSTAVLRSDFIICLWSNLRLHRHGAYLKDLKFNLQSDRLPI
jgi:hypothetical protein